MEHFEYLLGSYGSLFWFIKLGQTFKKLREY